jgi:hypothetical protein
VAAEVIASRWVSVIRGTSNPPVVEVISNAAEASGFSLLIPTWAKVVAVSNTAAKSVNMFFIGLLVYWFIDKIKYALLVIRF